jgi:hypothetical protein
MADRLQRRLRRVVTTPRWLSTGHGCQACMAVLRYPGSMGHMQNTVGGPARTS